MSDKKTDNVETPEVPEIVVVPVTPWYRKPKNIALAVTSTIATTAVVVWVRNKLNEDGDGFENLELPSSDTDS